MALKTISGTPAIAPPITAGKVPYANGTNALTYLPIGSAGQVLKVNTAGNAPSWDYPTGKTLLASYQGTVDITLTNIPQYYRELRIVMFSTGNMSNSFLTSFSTTTGTVTCVTSGYYAVNAGATVGTLNGTGTAGTMTHPRSGVLAYDGGNNNTVEIVLPEYSGSTYGGSTISTNRVIYNVMMTPPGGSTNSAGMGCAVTIYDASAAGVGINGFTIGLNSVNTTVWVYAS